jgi:hypothetical protein
LSGADVLPGSTELGEHGTNKHKTFCPFNSSFKCSLSDFIVTHLLYDNFVKHHVLSQVKHKKIRGRGRIIRLKYPEVGYLRFKITQAEVQPKTMNISTHKSERCSTRKLPTDGLYHDKEL